MERDDKYNPSRRADNCGFCCLSVALDLQGNFRDADRLYLETIKDLGLEPERDRDPVSRMLIFPQLDLSETKAWGNFDKLTGAKALDNYTITSVANRFNVRHRWDIRKKGRPATDVLAIHFLEFYDARSGRVNINEFIDFKREQQQKGGGPVPSVQKLRYHLATDVVGDSILGSRTARHYLTMHVTPTFEVFGYDAQDHRQYDLKGLMSRMQKKVDLVMHLER